MGEFYIATSGQYSSDIDTQGHDVIVTRTLSKVYGLAGLRIAYTLAQPARIKLINSRITTSRNQAALGAAAACLGDQAYLDGAIAYLKGCRGQIYRICEANSLRYLRSDGTFVYIDCGMPAANMQKRLAALSGEVQLFESEPIATGYAWDCNARGAGLFR